MRPNVLASKRLAAALYLELVRALERDYPGVDARLMEIAPGSLERQQLLASQLRESGARGDKRLLRQAQRVLQAILLQEPQAAVAIFADYDTVSRALLTLEKYKEIDSHGTIQHSGHPRAAAHPAAPAHLPAL
jgi:hypothetical protein